MNRFMRALIVLGLISACGEENVLTEGEVLSREYDDPDHGNELYCAAYGKYGCALWLNRDTYDGPHWYVEIRGLDDEGKWREEKHEVTQTLYDMASEGVYLDLDDGSIVAR